MTLQHGCKLGAGTSSSEAADSVQLGAVFQTFWAAVDLTNVTNWDAASPRGCHFHNMGCMVFVSNARRELPPMKLSVGTVGHLSSTPPACASQRHH
jgi:hypothetical protein